jgi:hypothetical protein
MRPVTVFEEDLPDHEALKQTTEISKLGLNLF